MSSPVAVTRGVFAVVYLGMLLGRLPRLQLDRTGVALLGAIALVALGVVSIEEASRAVDLPTIALLFALMVLSAQLRLGGFYGHVAAAVTRGGLAPAKLLLAVVLLAGGLAAVFTNDIVCLAVAPVLIDACRRRGLDPIPFLLGLACAANVGSAATLIGNPQNILIGATGVTERAIAALGAAGIDLALPGWLFAATVALSNTVSNVPAAMLLVPVVAGLPGGYPLAGPLLALTSTLAGNLLIVGSIANLIVADAAARHGIALGWRRHARTGVPVTLVTLALAIGWLWLRS